MQKSINDVIIIKEEENKIIFELNDINIPYAKILRDVVYTRVPTMAINEIHVIKNTSSLPYELIAQRIELIPIRANAELFTYYDGINHTDDDTLRFDLYKRGNDEYFSISLQTEVLSGDLKWIPNQSPDRNVGVADENYVIMTLLRGQKIELNCYATKGIGQYHSKFSPVSIFVYEKLEEKQALIKIDQIAQYPELSRKNQLQELTINDLSIFYPRSSFRFKMETKGQMPPRQILEIGLELTNEIMDQPYRERKKDIPFPGYLY